MELVMHRDSSSWSEMRHRDFSKSHATDESAVPQVPPNVSLSSCGSAATYVGWQLGPKGPWLRLRSARLKLTPQMNSQLESPRLRSVQLADPRSRTTGAISTMSQILK